MKIPLHKLSSLPLSCSASKTSTETPIARAATPYLQFHTRKYITDAVLARILDQSPVNRKLREAFRFQDEGECFRNTNRCLVRYAGLSEKFCWNLSKLITAEVDAKALSVAIKTEGPSK